MNMLRATVLDMLDERGWSRKEAIRRSGVAETPIMRWLRGQNNPNLRTVEPLLECLGIKLVPGGRGGRATAIIIAAMLKDSRTAREWARLLGLAETSISQIRTGARGMSVDVADRAMRAMRIELSAF